MIKGLEEFNDQNLAIVLRCMRVTSRLDIEKLRQIYCCVIATWFVMNDATPEDMNEKFKAKLGKYKGFIEMSEDRKKEINQEYPFMVAKKQKVEKREEKVEVE